jgi:FHS family L-fucose permease-like MFS transporter
MPVAQGWILDWGGDGFNDLNLFGFIPEVNFSFILPMICLLVVAWYGFKTKKKGLIKT